MAAISLTQKLEGKKKNQTANQTKHLLGILKGKIYYVSNTTRTCSCQTCPFNNKVCVSSSLCGTVSCSSLRLTSWLFLPEQHGPCTNYWKSFFLPMTSAYYHIHETLIN